VLSQEEKKIEKNAGSFLKWNAYYCKGKNILGNKQAQIHPEMIENLNQNFWS
jgi:hypothetical protein